MHPTFQDTSAEPCALPITTNSWPPPSLPQLSHAFSYLCDFKSGVRGGQSLFGVPGWLQGQKIFGCLYSAEGLGSLQWRVGLLLEGVFSVLEGHAQSPLGTLWWMPCGVRDRTQWLPELPSPYCVLNWGSKGRKCQMRNKMPLRVASLY